MKAITSIIFCATMVVTLSACSTISVPQTSVSFQGLSGASMSLRDPRVYMDDDGPVIPAWSDSNYKYLLSNPNTY
jgi:hypothetical protein